MDKDSLQKHLNFFFFYSKEDLESGCSFLRLASVIGADVKRLKNGVLDYLVENGFLVPSHATKGNMILSIKGMQEVVHYRAGKQFKIVRFRSADYVARETKSMCGYVFRYEVEHDFFIRESAIIGVFISDLLCLKWGLSFTNNGRRDMEKVLLQIALKKITASLEDGTLSVREDVLLQTSNQPDNCPFPPRRYIPAYNAVYEIAITTSKNYYLNTVSTMKAQKTLGKQNFNVYISFASQETEDINWVNSLAHELTSFNIQTQNRTTRDIGPSYYKQIEECIREANIFLFVLTPEYKMNAEQNLGAEGYEYGLIIDQIYRGNGTNKKYIPILKKGNAETSVPNSIVHIIAVDMSTPRLFEEGLQALVAAITANYSNDNHDDESF